MILAITLLYLLAAAMCSAMIYEADGVGDVRYRFCWQLVVLGMIWPLVAVIFILFAIDRHRNIDLFPDDDL